MLRAALLVLVACSPHIVEPAEPAQDRPLAFDPAPPPAVAPAPTPPAAPTTATHDSLAIGEVVMRLDECSGLGGEHYVIRLADGSGRVVHAGGHGSRLDLIPAGMTAPGMTKPTFVVVELEPDGAHPTPSELMIARGWCLDRMPAKLDGYVRRVVPGGGLGAARRVLAKLAVDGLPPPSTERRQTQVVRVIFVEQCVTAICYPR
jgi:hypothetical protein